MDNKNEILCQFPYRDAEITKIHKKSSNILILAYGIDKIAPKEVKNSLILLEDILQKLQLKNILTCNIQKIQFFSN